MKKIILNILVLVFFFKLPLLIADEKIIFVEGIDDLPIFGNMKNNNESLVVFDTNEGRFIKIEIYGEAKLEQAKNFYNNILPNLGWIEEKSNAFKREKEILTINYEENKKNLVIVFKILPN
jgi:hypothetical protein